MEVDVDGGTPTPVGDSLVEDPGRYSPGGGRILTSSHGHLLVLAADGAVVSDIADAGFFLFGAVWSPDGTRMAYSRSTSAFRADVFTSLPDGTDRRQVTATDANEIRVEWGPWSKVRAGPEVVPKGRVPGVRRRCSSPARAAGSAGAGATQARCQPMLETLANPASLAEDVRVPRSTWVHSTGHERSPCWGLKARHAQFRQRRDDASCLGGVTQVGQESPLPRWDGGAEAATIYLIAVAAASRPRRAGPPGRYVAGAHTLHLRSGRRARSQGAEPSAHPEGKRAIRGPGDRCDVLRHSHGGWWACQKSKARL